MTGPRQKQDVIEELRTLELIESLEAEGYSVQRNVKVGDVSFDLVATKGAERIAYEVKARAHLKGPSGQVETLHRAAAAAGYTLRTHVAVPPYERSIEVAGLEDSLRDYLSEHMPNPLEALGSYTVIDGVVDVEVDAISVTPSEIRVRGSATVEVTIGGGGSGDDAYAADDSFPFTFEAGLDHDIAIHDAEVGVDVSSYYE